MDPEFEAWVEDARKACEEAELNAPNESTLEFMFEDGLEPEDVADGEVQKRYDHTPVNRDTHNLAEVVANSYRPGE